MIDWSQVEVGCLILARIHEGPQFSILVTSMHRSEQVFHGLMLGHESPMVNNKVHLFAKSGPLFMNEDGLWSFEVIPVSGKESA